MKALPKSLALFVGCASGASGFALRGAAPSSSVGRIFGWSSAGRRPASASASASASAPKLPLFSSSLSDGDDGVSSGRPPAARTVSADISTVTDVSVSKLDGSSVELGNLVDAGRTTVLACLSHFGDFNAWEVAQQYSSAVGAGDFDEKCNIVLVGIGSPESASKFSDDLNLGRHGSRIQLVADGAGSVADALGCYRGWLSVDAEHAARWPATDVDPYVKLFGMIFGLGSPGTIERVLYGYVGDADGGSESRRWVVEALLQGTESGRWPKIGPDAFGGIPDDSGLRPFELATLRAQTGIHIVLNWGKLGPADGNLFTRMGGTFVFKDGDCVYEHYDRGILTYAPMQDVVAVAKEE